MILKKQYMNPELVIEEFSTEELMTVDASNIPDTEYPISESTLTVPYQDF